MNRREAAIISAYTGLNVGPFDATHAYIEQILGRPVWTHELAREDVWEQIKEKSFDDFRVLVESVAAQDKEPWETVTHDDEAQRRGMTEMLEHLPADKPVAFIDTDGEVTQP